MKRMIILFSVCVFILTARSSTWCPESDVDIHEIIRKQAFLIQEYEVLVKNLLVPAGAAGEFESFTIQNPDFYRDSFSRSRTAHVIRRILKNKPKLLAVFDECGLSQPGEYICRNKNCILHGYLFRQNQETASVPDHDLLSYVLYLSAVIGGLLLFVGIMGVGNRVCSWLDKKFPEDKSE